MEKGRKIGTSYQSESQDDSEDSASPGWGIDTGQSKAHRHLVMIFEHASVIGDTVPDPSRRCLQNPDSSCSGPGGVNPMGPDPVNKSFPSAGRHQSLIGICHGGGHPHG